MGNQNTSTGSSRSTGPRSEDGKEKSSRNAATHGLSCKKFFLLPNESEEDFQDHAQRWLDEYKQYSSPVLDMLLQDVIEAHWLQKRATLRTYESESALAMAELNRDPQADEIFKRLRSMQRYKTSYENSFQRALRAVHTFCKTSSALEVVQARLAHVAAATVAVKVKCLHRYVKLYGLNPEQARQAEKSLFSSKHPLATLPPA